MNASKPLNSKAYYSIPHLIGSRMDRTDKGCNAGQTNICLIKPRDKHDLITVTEKLDGSCVSVCKLDNTIIPLIRSGYQADQSHYSQHHLFSQWVYTNQDRFDKLLSNNERVCGEWLAQAHGTKYYLIHDDPFVAFDIIKDNKRLLWNEIEKRCRKVGIITAYKIHQGGSISIASALKLLGDYGFHGAQDIIEGAVWRVERNNEVDFLAKYVRPDKIDGLYLPGKSNTTSPIWNWKPDWYYEQPD